MYWYRAWVPESVISIRALVASSPATSADSSSSHVAQPLGSVPMMDVVQSVIEYLQSHPMLVFAIIFFLYNKWKASQPWPDFGGRITKVHNLEEWKALLSTDAQKAVVVDAYATWCGPCKVAAPIFAKLSEHFSAESCTFCKVDVDDARDVARELGITAMPTFKVFKNGTEVENQRGWPGEAKLKELLEKHGAKAAPASSKKAD